MKKTVVTGANGFIARNLIIRLRQQADLQVVLISKDDSEADIEKKLQQADIVYHLAGVNRPENEKDFSEVNHLFTRRILDILENSGNPYKLIYTSSIQAVLDNPYGKSKLAGEEELRKNQKGEIVVFRLP